MTENPRSLNHKLNVVTKATWKLYENSDSPTHSGIHSTRRVTCIGYTRMVNGVEMEFYYKNSRNRNL